jgi:ABC-type cobalamin/Fe3+-siderophores transport system ATPase subunit
MHEGAIAAHGTPSDVLTPDALARIYRIRADGPQSWSRL